MILTRIFFILLCMLSLGACKEEYTYPNVLTELTEIQTDAKGQLKELTTDRGEVFTIVQQQANNKFVADTLYRMLTIYEPIIGQTNQILVHSAQSVLSEIPIPASSFEEGIKTDPVDIQSIWKSGNYLNMILLVQTKDKPHVFHFVDQGISLLGNGKRKVLDLTIHHDRKGDYEAFTTKYCFSIPLKTFKHKMQEGDLIRFHLNTYKEGVTTREFKF